MLKPDWHNIKTEAMTNSGSTSGYKTLSHLELDRMGNTHIQITHIRMIDTRSLKTKGTKGGTMVFSLSGKGNEGSPSG